MILHVRGGGLPGRTLPRRVLLRASELFIGLIIESVRTPGPHAAASFFLGKAEFIVSTSAP